MQVSRRLDFEMVATLRCRWKSPKWFIVLVDSTTAKNASAETEGTAWLLAAFDTLWSFRRETTIFKSSGGSENKNKKSSRKIYWRRVTTRRIDPPCGLIRIIVECYKVTRRRRCPPRRNWLISSILSHGFRIISTRWLVVVVHIFSTSRFSHCCCRRRRFASRYDFVGFDIPTAALPVHSCRLYGRYFFSGRRRRRGQRNLAFIVDASRTTFRIVNDSYRSWRPYGNRGRTKKGCDVGVRCFFLFGRRGVIVIGNLVPGCYLLAMVIKTVDHLRRTDTWEASERSDIYVDLRGILVAVVGRRILGCADLDGSVDGRREAGAYDEWWLSKVAAFEMTLQKFRIG